MLEKGRRLKARKAPHFRFETKSLRQSSNPPTRAERKRGERKKEGRRRLCNFVLGTEKKRSRELHKGKKSQEKTGTGMGDLHHHIKKLGGGGTKGVRGNSFRSIVGVR